jgi:endonuclease-8
VPEGDTVYRHAQALHAALAGQTITRSDFRLPTLATASLDGYAVRECVSRGKHLLLRVVSPGGAARTLHSHLRMDGTWRVFRPGQRWAGRPAHTIRVVLSTARATAVGFHLHDVAIVPTAEEDRLTGHLGPDLLGTDWDAAVAVRRLASAPDAAIADALLDQRNLAGIGNLYKSEILFLRGIWPWRPIGELPPDALAATVELAHRLLRANAGRWTQSTTGSLRPGEETYVYRRPGRPCRRCGTPIEQANQGDFERVTFWCPACQPSGA